jgi:hypothetical protein
MRAVFQFDMEPHPKRLDIKRAPIDAQLRV